MPVAIAGIRVDSISITKEGDEQKITGSYAILTTEDKVLAKQSFNGYGDMKIPPSAETLKALSELQKCVKNDIAGATGLGGL